MCVCVCILTLGNQRARRMRHVLSSSMARLPRTYFVRILSHKRRNFRRNVTEHKICVLIFDINFVRNISHPKKTREILS